MSHTQSAHTLQLSEAVCSWHQWAVHKFRSSAAHRSVWSVRILGLAEVRTRCSPAELQLGYRCYNLNLPYLRSKPSPRPVAIGARIQPHAALTAV